MDKQDHLQLLGIGNALIDIQWAVNKDYIQSQNLAYGAMTLVDEERSLRLRQDMLARGDFDLSSGGSVANSLASFAALGGRGGFVGKLGSDELGEAFRQDLAKVGVKDGCGKPHASLATGRCVVMTSEDAERTMATWLGAASQFVPEDVPADLIGQAECTYLEGYLFDGPAAKDAFTKAAIMAHNAQKKVALSLSDPFCVERHRDDFIRLIKDYRLDLIFANQFEIESLFQETDLDNILRRLPQFCPLSVITMNAQGAIVVTSERIYRVEAIPPRQLVDSNGAGDGFAAGFLYGWLHQASPDQSARLGAAVASEIISHYGSRPHSDLKQYLP